MKNGKPLRTAYAALAVAAVGLLLMGAAILLRPKPSVLAVNSIEMAIPELHPARVEPVPLVVVPLIEKAQPQAEDKSAMPKAGDNSTNVAAAPMPEAPKASTTNSDPKQSSPRKHFIYGETAGTDPNE